MTNTPPRWRRLLRLGPSRRALIDETEALRAAIDELRADRDAISIELAEQQDAHENRVRDLRTEIKRAKAAAAAAYEMVEVGTCRKVRYVNRDDAQAHAAHIATNVRGTGYFTYQCPRCPQYPQPFESRPWHVATAKAGAEEAGHDVFRVNGTGQLCYPCGCRWHVKRERWDQLCAAHADPEVGATA